jgi:hypothetical protein
METLDVSLHEGKASLKLLNSLWVNSTFIYGLNVTGKAQKVIPYTMAQLQFKIKNKNIKLIASSTQASKASKQEKRVKVLPKKYWNNVPVVIFDNFVVITVFSGDKPSSVKIESKEVADALKKNFEFIWSKL